MSASDSGSFSFSRIKAGDYKIYFDTTGLSYTPEWYNDASSFAGATVVNVTEGGTTSGIDVQLNAMTISGTILFEGSPLSDVVMSGLPGNPLTNVSGVYSAIVDYNWSGTVMPTLTGYIFSPLNRVYTNITVSQIDQNYTASSPSTETVSTPNTPTGPSSGTISISYDFATGGSNSNLGDAVQYKFDWDDGS
ncbi:MAG: hypothetical protein L6428_12625, partial [Candidatus Aminicenantes bacterium]|nr:hypothetical protein [Candidatus Aminicenantes bacterium]